MVLMSVKKLASQPKYLLSLSKTSAINLTSLVLLQNPAWLDQHGVMRLGLEQHTHISRPYQRVD